MSILTDYQDFTNTVFIIPEEEFEKRLAYLYSGLAGEAGEVASLYAKYVRDNTSVEDLREKSSKEIGDVLWFVCQLANTLDLDIEELLRQNTEKLKSRMSRGKIGGSGDNR